MDGQTEALRGRLVERRGLLREATRKTGAAYLTDLLREVDGALARIDAGSFGLCETCNEPIEPERLLSDPLVRFCLDHLTTDQRRALEEDLKMAARIQTAILPERSVKRGIWEVCYHYEPLGPVSGDYCDLVSPEPDSGAVYFLLGDVAGKGVAASMLMSQLHALFRSLIALGLPPRLLMERANRLFGESTLAQHFATLICGKLTPDGGLEACNAAHCPALVIRRSGVSSIEPSGPPIGMFANSEYAAETMLLEPGDALVVYTDGISEAADPAGADYGAGRLCQVLAGCRDLSADRMVRACLDDLAAFCNGRPKNDDVTLMAIRYVQ